MPDVALPPLRDVIATHNLRAERKFGQNFILDLNLTQRIARAGGDLSECTVIEIVPRDALIRKLIIGEDVRAETECSGREQRSAELSLRVLETVRAEEDVLG